MLKLSITKDRSVLGNNFQDLKKQTPIAEEGKMLPLSYSFSSVEHLVDGHIFALEEDGIVEEEGLIYKKIEGSGSTNWTVFEIPESQYWRSNFLVFVFP